MANIKKTMRQTKEIAASNKAISEDVRALKETEIPGYCYNVMAQDFKNGVIDISIWPKMLKQDFGDKKVDIEFSETRGITIDSDDFDVVVNGKKNGKNDPDNTWAYLKQDGVSRAPLAHVTKLVMYYVRLKLMHEKEQEVKTEVNTVNVDCLEVMEKVVAKTAELLRKGDFDTVRKYIEEEN